MLKLEEKEFLLNSIRVIYDYPQPGIIFRDITTLINNKQAFSLTINHLKERYIGYNLDFIAGIESRGFIFGTALAYALNIGFVPIRKKGKLPYTTISEKYALEYGFSEIEIHIDAFKDTQKEIPNVLLIDDLIATGGTALAAANLIKQAGAQCVESCFIINLKDLQGAKAMRERTQVYSLLDL
ncbi:adenine phosphoribosyltransferase [Helicobacter turcicus]|uniref:Adenine phosphoribosyltransferase n=1 Tax=Helicobacter turcicus TaxID=2867412 RepID=A0ABS7JLK5_9HELI|nr:adenine phosphoribosyltransferase [Helicobacter turcicus]MBX7490273.1 adenine phosphoribosyltransferase [Helicobacter turcicus]MBX7545148.1 adenine phosphoribosyltransferase [Helicobacter turcicus]